MNMVNEKDSLKRKRSDADELIQEVLAKIPEEKKIEALMLLEGFALNESVSRKAG